MFPLPSLVAFVAVAAFPVILTASDVPQAVTVPEFIYTGRVDEPTVEEQAVAVPELK